MSGAALERAGGPGGASTEAGFGRYQVWIDLPASYATSDRKFPVVFVTDPQYALGGLPMIR